MGENMFGNNRKTIGVFTSQVNEEYQDTLSRGIMTKAKELDYNVAFFTNFGGFGQHSYDMGEAYIASLPIYEALDGIIITPDVMVLPGLEETYIRNIKSRCHCPIVSVRKETKGFYNVLIDDNTLSCKSLEKLLIDFPSSSILVSSSVNAILSMTEAFCLLFIGQTR
jgi:DNA-binding LacI/PurR family transcriptional regulator